MPRVPIVDKSGIGSLVHEEHELATDALDYFTLPKIDSSLIAGKHQVYYPRSEITENNQQNIEFTIVNDTNEFIMLDQTRLYGEVTFTKADGTTALTAAEKISVVNNFPQSLFKQVEVYLNNVCVSDLSTSYYHYKAFIENHFSYDEDVKNTTLKELEYYIKDSPKKKLHTRMELVYRNVGKL